MENLNIKPRDFKAGDVVTTKSGAELLILESSGCIIGHGVSYTTDAGEHVFNAGWTFSVKRPARSYTCIDYSDAWGPVNSEITLSTGEIFTVWHKSSTRSRTLVEMQDFAGGDRNRSSARAMADMLKDATLTGHSKIHFDGQKNGFTTTAVFPTA